MIIPLQLKKFVAMNCEIRRKNLEISSLHQKLQEASRRVTFILSEQHKRKDKSEEMEDRVGTVRVGAQVLREDIFKAAHLHNAQHGRTFVDVDERHLEPVATCVQELSITLREVFHVAFDLQMGFTTGHPHRW